MLKRILLLFSNISYINNHRYQKAYIFDKIYLFKLRRILFQYLLYKIFNKMLFNRSVVYVDPNILLKSKISTTKFKKYYIRNKVTDGDWDVSTKIVYSIDYSLLKQKLFKHAIEYSKNEINKLKEIENYSSRQLTLGAKVQLWQEQRHVPKAIIGLSSQSRYQIFLTKIFNLPRIHTFQLYGGFRYLFSQSDAETKAIGFLGWQKQVQPALINGDLIFRLGTDFGSSGFSKAYLITRLITQTGLWVDLQLAGDTKLAQIQGSVSWSNQQLLAQIESVKRLAQNVSRLRQRQQNQNSD